jgi:hypothetical protein
MVSELVDLLEVELVSVIGLVLGVERMELGIDLVLEFEMVEPELEMVELEIDLGVDCDLVGVE